MGERVANLMDWKEWDVKEWGVIVSSVTAVGLFCWRYVIRPVVTYTVAFFAVPGALADLRKELKPNGGASSFDILRQIQKDVETLKDNGAMNLGRFRAQMMADEKPIWESDAKGRTVWANPALCQVFGRSMDEFTGSNWINIIEEKDRERVIREWESAIEDVRTFRLRYNVLGRNDNPIAVEALCFPVVSGNRVIGFVGTLRFL